MEVAIITEKCSFISDFMFYNQMISQVFDVDESCITNDTLVRFAADAQMNFFDMNF